MVWLPTGAAFNTSITLRYDPGLPPETTWAPVLLPPFPARNWVPVQSVSRNVLSETVCANAEVGSSAAKIQNATAVARVCIDAVVERNMGNSRCRQIQRRGRWTASFIAVARVGCCTATRLVLRIHVVNDKSGGNSAFCVWCTTPRSTAATKQRAARRRPCHCHYPTSKTCLPANRLCQIGYCFGTSRASSTRDQKPYYGGGGVPEPMVTAAPLLVLADSSNATAGAATARRPEFLMNFRRATCPVNTSGWSEGVTSCFSFISKSPDFRAATNRQTSLQRMWTSNA